VQFLKSGEWGHILQAKSFFSLLEVCLPQLRSLFALFALCTKSVSQLFCNQAVPHSFQKQGVYGSSSRFEIVSYPRSPRCQAHLFVKPSAIQSCAICNVSELTSSVYRAGASRASQRRARPEQAAATKQGEGWRAGRSRGDQACFRGEPSLPDWIGTRGRRWRDGNACTTSGLHGFLGEAYTGGDSRMFVRIVRIRVSWRSYGCQDRARALPGLESARERIKREWRT